MSRIATPSLSTATRPPVELPPSRTLSPAAGPVAQAPQGGRPLLPEAHRGVSSFAPATGVLGSQATAPDVSLVIRDRMNDVLRRTPGYQSTVDRIASQLTPQEQRMIMNAPPEKREEVRAQIQQKHEALAQQMRNAVASVDQPFNPAERQDGLSKSTQALKDSVNQMFDLATQQLEHVPPEWREQVQTELQTARAGALEQIDTQAARMGSTTASFQEIASGQQQLKNALYQAQTAVNRQILNFLPPEQRPNVQMDLLMQHMDQSQALDKLLGSAMQPSSSTDFSRLPYGAPEMTGPLTQDQARQALAQLENGIQLQFQVRMHSTQSLPPELRNQAVFDAYVQRDKMLMSAYRNILDRVTPTPPPAPLPVPDTAS